MITQKELQLHANGIPPGKVNQFSAIARAAIKAGCSLLQARCLAVMAYNAASGFYWNLPKGSGIRIHTEIENKVQKQALTPTSPDWENSDIAKLTEEPKVWDSHNGCN